MLPPMRTIMGKQAGTRVAVAFAATVALAACDALTPFTQPPANPRAAIVKTLREAAKLSQQSNDHSGAVNFYRNLYERDPADLEAAAGYVRNLRYLGAHGQAIEVAIDVLKRAPDHPAIVAELGKAQLAAGQGLTALDTLARAIELDPKDWRARSALGIGFDLMGNHARAQQTYEAALAIAANELSLVNNLALSRALGGDIEGAIARLEAVVQTPRASAHVRQNLALLHAIQGNLARTEALLRRDLPPDVVQSNLAYYRALATAR
ncbi:MAG: tetratricopeptide repeat protein [Alphaproteobacteria bacterium]|nr:tetratricopeptide repeat protein [Alphaproteobacteria bacterium]